jgi:hypothetical protein
MNMVLARFTHLMGKLAYTQPAIASAKLWYIWYLTAVSNEARFYRKGAARWLPLKSVNKYSGLLTLQYIHNFFSASEEEV